jgi:hypothetical protein
LRRGARDRLFEVGRAVERWDDDRHARHALVD